MNEARVQKKRLVDLSEEEGAAIQEAHLEFSNSREHSY